MISTHLLNRCNKTTISYPSRMMQRIIEAKLHRVCIMRILEIFDKRYCYHVRPLWADLAFMVRGGDVFTRMIVKLQISEIFEQLPRHHGSTSLQRSSCTWEGYIHYVDTKLLLSNPISTSEGKYMVIYYIHLCLAYSKVRV